MLNLPNKKKIENLTFENTRLSIKIKKLENQVLKFKKENEQQQILLSDWEKLYKDSLLEINKLKKELKEYNPKLKPRTKKISQSDIKRIKDLHSLNEHTYREISQMTKWSVCTVSKVINGFYDY